MEATTNDRSAACGQSVLTDRLGGMTPAAWMYKNANTDNWYLRWSEAPDRLSVPLYTPEQIAEIVASEHRHQRLLEENCRILRREVAAHALALRRCKEEMERTAYAWGPDDTPQEFADAAMTADALLGGKVSPDEVLSEEERAFAEAERQRQTGGF